MLLVYRLFLTTLVSRLRLIALAAAGLVGVLLGLVVRNAPDDVTEPDRINTLANVLVGGYYLNLVVPVVALAFASAAFGDTVDDKTLVYLWLTPLARWRLVVAGLLASFTIAIPVAVVPVGASALVADAPGKLVVGSLIGAALATAGYVSLFLLLGLLVRRALAWGLAYVLIWELAVARIAKGAARLSVSVYSRSVLADVAETPPPLNPAAVSTSLIALGVVVVLAVLATERLLTNADVA